MGDTPGPSGGCPAPSCPRHEASLRQHRTHATGLSARSALYHGCMATITEDEIRAELIALDPERAADVSRWDVEIGEDSVGGPAVFVTVVYRDDRLYGAWPSHGEYRKRIEARLDEVAPERWPFVWFSAESVAIDPEARSA